MGVHHRNLDVQRERLIEFLIEYRKRTGHSIVIVFDGWKEGVGPETSSVRGGVKVIYSGLGEKADSVIKRILSSERRSWIVVSSDKEIVKYAWATDSTPIGSEQFLPFLQKAEGGLNSGPGVSFSKDEEEGEGPGKGRARMLSKKEKAIQRALGKLR